MAQSAPAAQHVLLATHGEHPFFAGEGKQVHDIRRRPILFEGYAIGCRKGRASGTWHASVRIERKRFREMKERFEEAAIHRTTEDLCRELRSTGFEPYAPVRDQLRQLRRAINRRRQAAGLELIPPEAVGWRRSPVRPFE